MTELTQDTDIARLQVRIELLEQRVINVEADIKDLLRFMSEINMLVKISIGGGALTIVNLIVVILDKVS